MKLSAKFNLIFLLVFGVGMAGTGLAARRFLQESARTQVIDQARLMMATSASTRLYTAEQVRPLFEKWQEREKTFYQQSVPAYTATQIFKALQKTYPEYTYKEAALNPTNLQDRAVDWEADIINAFRNDGSKAELVGERDTPTGRSLFLAKPMKAVASCMPCHGSPQAAPAGMITIYGANNGFGWKLDEVAAAQIVSVPMAIPVAIADKATRNLLMWLGGISLLSLVLLNVVLAITVVRPVSQLARSADEISKGNLEAPEFPITGSDEVSMLADSFNRMRRSLAKAIKMLEGA